MRLAHIDRKNLFHVLPVNVAKQTLEYWKRILNYQSFSELNKRKMQKSKASIVFSDYMARLLIDNVGDVCIKNKYNNGSENKCKVIYHGAEPSQGCHVTKESSKVHVFSSNRHRYQNSVGNRICDQYQGLGYT